MRYIVMMLLCGAITGCTRNAQPATPAEQEEQEIRMRNLLNDTSPRNRDHRLPKVVPEFSKPFNTHEKSAKENDKPAVTEENKKW